MVDELYPNPTQHLLDYLDLLKNIMTPNLWCTEVCARSVVSRKGALILACVIEFGEKNAFQEMDNGQQGDVWS